VLQCSAACCSVLQYVAVCCSVLQCVAGLCSWTERGVIGVPIGRGEVKFVLLQLAF